MTEFSRKHNGMAQTRGQPVLRLPSPTFLAATGIHRGAQLAQFAQKHEARSVNLALENRCDKGKLKAYQQNAHSSPVGQEYMPPRLDEISVAHHCPLHKFILIENLKFLDTARLDKFVTIRVVFHPPRWSWRMRESFILGSSWARSKAFLKWLVASP